MSYSYYKYMRMKNENFYITDYSTNHKEIIGIKVGKWYSKEQLPGEEDGKDDELSRNKEGRSIIISNLTLPNNHPTHSKILTGILCQRHEHT